MFSKFQFSPCQNSCLHKQLQSCILTLHVYVHWAIKNGCREISPKLDWSLVWNSSLISWETTMTEFFLTLFSRYSYQEDLSGVIWHQFNPYTQSHCIIATFLKIPTPLHKLAHFPNTFQNICSQVVHPFSNSQKEKSKKTVKCCVTSTRV